MAIDRVRFRLKSLERCESVRSPDEHAYGEVSLGWDIGAVGLALFGCSLCACSHSFRATTPRFRRIRLHLGQLVCKLRRLLFQHSLPLTQRVPSVLRAKRRSRRHPLPNHEAIIGHIIHEHLWWSIIDLVESFHWRRWLCRRGELGKWRGQIT